MHTMFLIFLLITPSLHAMSLDVRTFSTLLPQPKEAPSVNLPEMSRTEFEKTIYWAKKGDIESCEKIGSLLLCKDNGVTPLLQSHKLSKKDLPNYLECAARQGSSSSQYLLGWHNYKQKNHTEAKWQWVQAANKGSIDALEQLGEMFLWGIGTQPNVDSALKKFKQVPTARAFYGSGLCYLQKNKLNQALACAVAAAGNGHSQGHLLASKVCEISKDYTGAFNHLCYSQEKNVGNIKYCFQELGKAAYTDEKVEIAKKCFDKVPYKNLSEDAQFMYAMCLFESGNEAEASKSLRRLAKTAKNSQIKEKIETFLNGITGKDSIEMQAMYVSLVIQRDQLAAIRTLERLFEHNKMHAPLLFSRLHAMGTLGVLQSIGQNKQESLSGRARWLLAQLYDAYAYQIKKDDSQKARHYFAKANDAIKPLHTPEALMYKMQNALHGNGQNQSTKTVYTLGLKLKSHDCGSELIICFYDSFSDTTLQSLENKVEGKDGYAAFILGEYWREKDRKKSNNYFKKAHALLPTIAKDPEILFAALEAGGHSISQLVGIMHNLDIRSQSIGEQRRIAVSLPHVTDSAIKAADLHDLSGFIVHLNDLSKNVTGKTLQKVTGVLERLYSARATTYQRDGKHAAYVQDCIKLLRFDPQKISLYREVLTHYFNKKNRNSFSNNKQVHKLVRSYLLALENTLVTANDVFLLSNILPIYCPGTGKFEKKAFNQLFGCSQYLLQILHQVARSQSKGARVKPLILQAKKSLGIFYSRAKNLSLKQFTKNKKLAINLLQDAKIYPEVYPHLMRVLHEVGQNEEANALYGELEKVTIKDQFKRSELLAKCAWVCAIAALHKKNDLSEVNTWLSKIIINAADPYVAYGLWKQLFSMINLEDRKQLLQITGNSSIKNAEVLNYCVARGLEKTCDPSVHSPIVQHLERCDQYAIEARYPPALLHIGKKYYCDTKNKSQVSKSLEHQVKGINLIGLALLQADEEITEKEALATLQGSANIAALPYLCRYYAQKGDMSEFLNSITVSRIKDYYKSNEDIYKQKIGLDCKLSLDLIENCKTQLESYAQNKNIGALYILLGSYINQASGMFQKKEDEGLFQVLDMVISYAEDLYAQTRWEQFKTLLGEIYFLKATNLLDFDQKKDAKIAFEKALAYENETANNLSDKIKKQFYSDDTLVSNKNNQQSSIVEVTTNMKDILEASNEKLKKEMHDKQFQAAADLLVKVQQLEKQTPQNRTARRQRDKELKKAKGELFSSFKELERDGHLLGICSQAYYQSDHGNYDTFLKLIKIVLVPGKGIVKNEKNEYEFRDLLMEHGVQAEFRKLEKKIVSLKNSKQSKKDEPLKRAYAEFRQLFEKYKLPIVISPPTETGREGELKQNRIILPMLQKDASEAYQKALQMLKSGKLEEGYQLIQAEAQKNNIAACGSMVHAYIFGDGPIKQNYEKALEHVKQIIANGGITTIKERAQYSNMLTEQMFKRVFQYLAQEAYLQNNSKAQQMLDKIGMLLKNKGIDYSLESRNKEYTKNGGSAVHRMIGKKYMEIPVPTDQMDEQPPVELCEINYLNSISYLGEDNYSKAYQLLAQLVQKDKKNLYFNSRLLLALMLMHGKGVKQDFQQACKYIEQATESNLIKEGKFTDIFGFSNLYRAILCLRELQLQNNLQAKIAIVSFIKYPWFKLILDLHKAVENKRHNQVKSE